MAVGGRLWSRLEGSARLDLIRRSAAVSPGLTALAGGLTLISGLLPAAFSLATGALAQRVPPAVGQGIGSPSGSRLVVALLVAAAVYVLIQIVGPVRATISEILLRRVDASLSLKLMRLVSAPRSIAHLEDARVLDRIAQAQGAANGATVGGTVMYLFNAWATRLQGFAALVILARFRWWLAVVLAGGQAVSLSWRRRHWLEVTKVVFDRTDSMRKADYVRNLAMLPQAAKESQVFSLAGWLVDRYRTSFLDTMQPVWRTRRSGGAVALGVAVLMLVLEGVALVLVARAGVEETISLGAAVVYAQAVLATGALGSFDLGDVRLEDGLSPCGCSAGWRKRCRRRSSASVVTCRPPASPSG